MKRLTTLLSLRDEWREITSAPFDREIEIAIIDVDINVPGGTCLVRATAGSMRRRIRATGGQ